MIILAGPTGSGKTNLAIKITQFLSENYGDLGESEIINADCIQLYRGLRIISNQPSKEDFSIVRHNLYGILSPFEKSSAAFWIEKAYDVINRLNSEKKIPILCGGTGFYIDAFLNGLSTIPEIPDEFRDSVLKKYKEIGRDRFFNELSTLDPELTKTLHKNNTQRLLRAYEVALFTGKSLSEWWKNGMEIGGNKHNAIIFVFIPPKDKLKTVIINRTHKMIESGAVEEVKEFVSRFKNYDGPLCKTIGYLEILSFLKGEITETELVSAICTKTMQYAKRQSTWFRNKMNTNNVKFLDGFGDDKKIIAEVFDTIQKSEQFK